MLQKIYWLGQIQGAHIHETQEFRTLFCKHEFLIPYHLSVSPTFMMVDGGLVSNSYACTLIINNRSIFTGPGSFCTSADHISEQIRRFLLLRMNLFFGQSPEEVERYYNTLPSIANNLIPQKILPDIFSETRTFTHEEMLSLNSWFQKVLSLPRQKYKIVCQGLAAYERALQVLSSDAALSYSLLVFVIEALANNHSAYHATWDDIGPMHRQLFDALFEDERISSIDTSWIDDLRKVLVEIIHPGATKRFTRFALDHISSDLYSASNSNTKSPLRRSRIYQSIQNAYDLRSLFSHELTPLTQLLISASYRAEEIEEEFEQRGRKVKTSYLTLRGLFRVVRSILLEFIEQQEVADLKFYNWSQESDYGLVEGVRVPAYVSLKNSEGELLNLEADYAKNRFEDILVIYQDNYIERLHEQFSENQTKNQIDSDVFLGVPDSASYMAGRMLFRFDPSPSYNWQFLKQQALQLIAQSDKIKKGYLQAIALLCAHLAMMDGAEEEWESVLKVPAFGTPLFGLERFIVDVIHNTTSCWLCKQAEEIFEKHLKNPKIFIPTRVEIACMLELAKLFKNEGLDEGRRKWLNAAYGDTALYPNLQNLIHNAMNSDDMVVQPQEALNIL
jgi:hypothetical protein